MKQLRDEDKIITQVKHIHMIGIGGSGMCPLAEILHGKGYILTGSDNNESDPLTRIKNLGIKVYMGHRAENIKGAELVVYSAAIAADNPELCAAREQGIAVDGVHVGQSDIPVEVCRKQLGPNAIVGLSARCEEMLEYVKTADMSLVDYLGIGPLHETETKRDCGCAADGSIITKSFEDLAALHAASPVPIVVGGGVKTADLPQLKATGVDGFFVVSAVCSADDPYAAAKELVDTWQQA